jgi:hypothetical protein
VASQAQSHTVAVFIASSPSAIAAFVSNPLNLAVWAGAFCKSVRRNGPDWLVETPQGEAKIRFVPPNSYGILDHYVTLPSGHDVYAPMRVIENGNGSEVLFTVLRLADMSDRQLEEDAAMVKRDLLALKSLMESKAAQ